MSWSDLSSLCENVKQRIYQEHNKRDLPGRPFVTCRVTQLYPTGVCVYFYFAFHFKGVDSPSAIFAEIEHAAREEILRSGGSLSHHHGVGKLREPFLPLVMSGAGLEFRREPASFRHSCIPPLSGGTHLKHLSDFLGPPHPNRLAGGRKGSIKAHSASVRSLA